MKTELKERLKSYSLAAGAVLSAGAAKPAVIYTDVNPDQTLSLNGQFYLLDLNNDNIDDFRIDVVKSNFTFSTFAYSFFWVTVTPLGLNQVAASSSYYAQALAQNVQINNAMSWANSSSMLMAGRFRTATLSSSFSYSFGKWTNATDKYLGLKLRVGANTYYGWARLDLNMTTKSVTIKDYAYENQNNVPTLAGYLTADPVSSIVASDVSDASNGSDMQVAFNKAFDENTVSEYRIMAVKNANAGSFNLAAAQAVPVTNYTAVTPNGSNISTTLPAAANDVNGDPISIGQTYRVFVLSKADGVLRTNDALSLQSNAVVLNTTAEAVTNLIATDITNNHNVSDLEVSFTRAPLESRISEYRVIVVKSVDAASFNLTAAQTLAPGRYEVILPNGSNIQQVLTSTTTDKDGFGIVESIPYKYFVFSKANGTTANIDNLSVASNEFILSPTTGLGEALVGEAKIYVSSGQLYVHLTKADANGMIRVLDQSGRLIYESGMTSQNAQFPLSVNPGVYLVRLSLEDGPVIERVMVD